MRAESTVTARLSKTTKKLYNNYLTPIFHVWCTLCGIAFTIVLILNLLFSGDDQGKANQNRIKKNQNNTHRRTHVRGATNQNKIKKILKVKNLLKDSKVTTRVKRKKMAGIGRIEKTK